MQSMGGRAVGAREKHLAAVARHHSWTRRLTAKP
jgi:hypothetical protein